MEIRKYKTGDDFAAISRIYAMSWKRAYRGIVPDAYLKALKENRWETLLQKERDNLLLAIDGAEIIGAATYGPAREKKYHGWGEVVSVYLLPAAFRQGIGSRLLRRACKELENLGYSQVYLWVLMENTAARRFYEANGFRCNGDTIICEIGGKALKETRYLYDGK
ncbi:MAG TPA: GNAT family N-acetyltransferase [Clostridiales bacterium]|nr:GNAT family N-acetyltransferase [Clostridiales bacterium]